MKGKNVLSTIAIIIVCAATFNRSEAKALPDQESPEPGQKKPRPKSDNATLIAEHALAFPAYFFMHSSIHELSHSIVVSWEGAQVTEIKPYPHTLNGHFVFGSMSYSGRLTDRQEAWMLAAPSLTDVAIFTASDLALDWLVAEDSMSAPFLLAAGMVAPLADFLVGVNGRSDFNDTTRLGKLIGVPKWSIMVAGDAMAVIAVWRILHHARNIFTVAQHGPGQRRGGDIGFAIVPTIGPDRYTINLMIAF